MKNVDNVFFSKFLNAEEKESVYNAGKMEDQRFLHFLLQLNKGILKIFNFLILSYKLNDMATLVLLKQKRARKRINDV